MYELAEQHLRVVDSDHHLDPAESTSAPDLQESWHHVKETARLFAALNRLRCFVHHAVDESFQDALRSARVPRPLQHAKCNPCGVPLQSKSHEPQRLGDVRDSDTAGLLSLSTSQQSSPLSANPIGAGSEELGFPVF